MTLMIKDVEHLLERAPSKYRLSVVASKRARQINNGSPLLVQSRAQKSTTQALEELAHDKLVYTFEDNVTSVKKNPDQASEQAN